MNNKEALEIKESDKILEQIKTGVENGTIRTFPVDMWSSYAMALYKELLKENKDELS